MVLETSGSTPSVMPWASATRDGGLRLFDQVAEGIGKIVVRMPSPHVVAVARAGAQRHDRAAEPLRDFDDPLQSVEPLIAQPPIGMDHVVGARQRGKIEAALGKAAADPFDRRVVDPRRQGLSNDAGKIELHGPGFGGQHGIEVLCERRVGKFGGKKAKVQHVVTIIFAARVEQLQSAGNTESVWGKWTCPR